MSEKHSFFVQRYYLKWLCGMPLFGIALLIEYFISKHLHSDFLFYTSCVIVMGLLLTAYYFTVDKLRLFGCTGCYWAEDGTVFIEIGKRRYEIREIRTLMGGEPNVFFWYYAYLLIETPTEKIKIFGQTLHGNQQFADSDLQPLFACIRQLHPELKPKTILGAETENWFVSDAPKR